jgi:hypothetical protein
MRFSSHICCILLLTAAISLAGDDSASINKQLDTLQNLKLDTTLPEAIRQIGNQAGIRIDADPAVWALLPWGDQTSIRANIQNRTLRQGLTAITQKLGLEFVLTNDSVQLRPVAALRRLGRRATLDEVAVLDLLGSTAIGLGSDRPSVREIVAAVNEKLAAMKSPFAVMNQLPDAVQDGKVAVPANASLTEALEDAAAQAGAAWFPRDRAIVIITAAEQIRSQLARPITARYNGVDIAQVLLELFQHADVHFTVEPGSYEKVPAADRSIQLSLDNTSMLDALQSLTGCTGLSFELTNGGVSVRYARDGNTASQPANR